jgi:hypothetical protein
LGEDTASSGEEALGVLELRSGMLVKSGEEVGNGRKRDGGVGVSETGEMEV